VKRLLVSLVCSLLVGGCAWTDSGDGDRGSAARPVARLIAYAKYLPGGEAEIWVARVDGSGKRRLAEGRSPAISPDGRWVVFEGGLEAVFEPRFYRDLLLVSTAGGRPRLLAQVAMRPVWSPDSKRIVVLRDLDDRRRALLSIAVETGESTTVARWGAHEIWGVRPDGGGRRLLTKTPRRLLGQGIVGLVPVAWSADGRVLLAGLANEFGLVPFAVDPQTGSVRRIGITASTRPRTASRATDGSSSSRTLASK
jgi:Tol biopolymer transport system component